MRIKYFIAGILALVVQPARAEWLEASGDHFVIYADDREQDLTQIAENLESFHAAMSRLTGAGKEKPSPSARVTVYFVRNEAQVRAILDAGNRFAAGFYNSRAGNSIAVVPNIDASQDGRNGKGELDFAMIALLHEYAHHFFNSQTAYAMPRWLSEGAAEFYSSAAFLRNGGVSVGRPAHHRAGELLQLNNVSVEELLDPDKYDYEKKIRFQSFYGKAWLLYHYLYFSQERKGQLKAYVDALIGGAGQRAAADSAFGDLRILARDLDQYLDQRRLSAISLNKAMLATSPIAIRRLREGEAAILSTVIRSRRGVTTQAAEAIAAQARTVAGQFPSDPAVLAALAEAEFDAGHDAAAIAAADAALAKDPGTTNAYLQKGYALLRMAQDAPDRAKAFNLARGPFVALNRRENDHPLPMLYNYLSYLRLGATPSENAIAGLRRAVEVAPFDKTLLIYLAMQEMRDGNSRAAIAALGPVATDPHGGALASKAAEAIRQLQASPSWAAQNAHYFSQGETDGAEDDQQ